MIRYVYDKEREWKVYHIAWSFTAFLVNNLIFFYMVAKVCFFQYLSPPPWPLSLVILVLLLADSLYPILLVKNLRNARLIIDCIIWIFVFMFALFPQHFVTSCLSLTIIIRLYDMFYLKQMAFDLVKRNYWLYKIYIVAKIIYLMLLYGQITGCIFYAIQAILLDLQYFGTFSDNPLNYYQGLLLAYTPINMFQDMTRYVYAMYFIVALISTIAFGDIIGKNYIEDAYVTILIILSTIGIALIIEQMYIIFRRKKTKYMLLMNQMRFLSQRFKEYDQIPKSFRQQMINYLIQVNWKYMIQQPEQLKNLPEMRNKLIKQSIINNHSLPLLFQKYLLHKLTLTNIPQNYQFYFNMPRFCKPTCFFVVSGGVYVGHKTCQGKNVGGYLIKEKGTNYGIQQSVLGTNSLYEWLYVQTTIPTKIFSLSHETMRSTLNQFLNIEYSYDSPLEHFQIEKDKAMFNKYKYKCSICEVNDHTLLQCPTCHLVFSSQQLSSLRSRQNKRQYIPRSRRKSDKIFNKCLRGVQDIKRQSQKLDTIRDLKEKLKALRLTSQNSQKPFQIWHHWKIYQKQNMKQLQ